MVCRNVNWQHFTLPARLLQSQMLSLNICRRSSGSCSFPLRKYFMLCTCSSWQEVEAWPLAFRLPLTTHWNAPIQQPTAREQTNCGSRKRRFMPLENNSEVLSYLLTGRQCDDSEKTINVPDTTGCSCEDDRSAHWMRQSCEAFVPLHMSQGVVLFPWRWI